MNKPKKPVTLISLGNEFRGDDAAALLIQKQLKATMPDLYKFHHHNGDPSSLIYLWKEKDVIILDAIDCKNLEAGSILEFNPYEAKTIHWESQASSSHALSLDMALKLSIELNCRPSMIAVYGIVGKDFSIGSPISPEVVQACHKLTKLLQEKSKET